jgi:hypothetical protein
MPLPRYCCGISTTALAPAAAAGATAGATAATTCWLQRTSSSSSSSSSCSPCSIRYLHELRVRLLLKRCLFACCLSTRVFTGRSAQLHASQLYVVTASQHHLPYSMLSIAVYTLLLCIHNNSLNSSMSLHRALGTTCTQQRQQQQQQQQQAVAHSSTTSQAQLLRTQQQATVAVLAYRCMPVPLQQTYSAGKTFN